MTVTVIGPRTKEEGLSSMVINTTSRALGWSRGLSPFLCGPVELYGGYVSQNVENAWQYAKVYPQMVDENQEPTEEYWKWAKSGWNSKRAMRYPLGKGGPKPLYSFWDGKKMGYIEARLKIYCPVYSKAVEQTYAYQVLKSLYEKWGRITLWDFDGYDHRAKGLTYQDVFLDSSRPAGHGFVLAAMLEDKRIWEHLGVTIYPHVIITSVD